MLGHSLAWRGAGLVLSLDPWPPAPIEGPAALPLFSTTLELTFFLIHLGLDGPYPFWSMVSLASFAMFSNFLPGEYPALLEANYLPSLSVVVYGLLRKSGKIGVIIISGSQL